jgi:universal stress protein E
MTDINRIVCYLSPEQLEAKPGLSHVKALADAGAGFHLVANDYDASAEAVLSDEEAFVAAVEHLQDEGERRLTRLAGKAGVDWPADVVWDRTGRDWLAESQGAYDLIVMFGQRDKAHYSLPSEWSMLRALARPLYVVNPGRTKHDKGPVLAAVDIANASQAALNGQVMQAAKAMADVWGSDLHMVSVIPMSQVVADLEFVDRRKYEADFRAKHQAALEDLAARFGVGKDHIHMEIGVPHSVIRKTAKKLDVLMTAVGTVQRTGLSGFLVGNTVEKLLWQAKNNILVVPEAG